MMDIDIHDLITRIHAKGHPVVLALTGGGISAASLLLSVPGGSRTVLEVIVPYAVESFDDFLRRAPANYCSAPTAILLARRSQERGRWLSNTDVLGLGCTASLRSDRPKKGEHRIHVAVTGEQGTFARSLILAKDQRTREEEEDVAARLILDTLARSLGLPGLPEILLLPGEQIEEYHEQKDSIEDLLEGQISLLAVLPDGRIRRDASAPSALLPGSFNPLHVGHRRLAEVAARRVNGLAAFEISVTNVEKPTLQASEVHRRLAQFQWYAEVWLTRAPTFIEKARLFPQTVFVVGADTAERILQTRFYGDSEEKMRQALEEIRTLGCRFLVAGRIDSEGKFQSVEDLKIPEAFRDLFEAIAEDEFRLDLSSTEIRRHQTM